MKGLVCPTQMLFSHFICYYFSIHSLMKNCSNILILETDLRVRKAKAPSVCFYNKRHSGLYDILAGRCPSSSCSEQICSHHPGIFRASSCPTTSKKFLRIWWKLLLTHVQTAALGPVNPCLHGSF